MTKEKKAIRLTDLEKSIYNFLLIKHKEQPEKWWSKMELLDCVPELKTTAKETSHDICSNLNHIRLRINQATSEGQLDKIILLNNSSFKIATDKDEAEEYIKKDYQCGIKRLIRYYQNRGIIRQNGQGKLFDLSGNEITEESINKRFRSVFENNINDEGMGY